MRLVRRANWSRHKSTSRIAEVNGNISDGDNLHTIGDPSKTGGRGRHLLRRLGRARVVNDTKVVAVVSFGFNATCHGAPDHIDGILAEGVSAP